MEAFESASGDADDVRTRVVAGAAEDRALEPKEPRDLESPGELVVPQGKNTRPGFLYSAGFERTLGDRLVVGQEDLAGG